MILGKSLTVHGLGLLGGLNARDDVAAVVDRLDEHGLGEDPLKLVEDEVVRGRELAGQVDVEDARPAGRFWTCRPTPLPLGATLEVILQ